MEVIERDMCELRLLKDGHGSESERLSWALELAQIMGELGNEMKNVCGLPRYDSSSKNIVGVDARFHTDIMLDTDKDYNDEYNAQSILQKAIQRGYFLLYMVTKKQHSALFGGKRQIVGLLQYSIEDDTRMLYARFVCGNALLKLRNTKTGHMLLDELLIIEYGLIMQESYTLKLEPVTILTKYYNDWCPSSRQPGIFMYWDFPNPAEGYDNQCFEQRFVNNLCEMVIKDKGEQYFQRLFEQQVIKVVDRRIVVYIGAVELTLNMAARWKETPPALIDQKFYDIWADLRQNLSRGFADYAKIITAQIAAAFFRRNIYELHVKLMFAVRAHISYAARDRIIGIGPENVSDVMKKCGPEIYLTLLCIAANKDNAEAKFAFYLSLMGMYDEETTVALDELFSDPTETAEVLTLVRYQILVWMLLCLPPLQLVEFEIEAATDCPTVRPAVIRKMHDARALLQNIERATGGTPFGAKVLECKEIAQNRLKQGQI